MEEKKNTEPLIDLRNITKIYKMGDEEVRASDGVNLVIYEGEFVAIGGILGIIVGCAVTKTAGKLMGIGAYPTFGSILISFGVSVGIGLIFGYMPASRAASMSPIDALRSE